VSSTRTLEPAPLIADVPAAPPAPWSPDPFQALDDLMAVLEALCPRWPVRPPSTDMTDMRL